VSEDLPDPGGVRTGIRHRTPSPTAKNRIDRRGLCSLR
jgi:hypothetical protein